MERPERPSRPEKGARSGSHPYRERHRIVSSDSDSDMEVDLSAPIRVRIVQRPTRPSVEVIQSGLPLQNSSSVSAAGSSSTSSTDPYHLPPRTNIRLRESQNADASQPLYPFMMKDDVPHRAPALFYRKRPQPQHFVPALSGTTLLSERRSNNQNCTRVRFPSPHSSGSSSNWEAKRFCPGPPGDPLATGPDPKMQHRLVSATVASSCMMEPHSHSSGAPPVTTSDRPDHDELRLRSLTNIASSWTSSTGPNDVPRPNVAVGGLLQFFEGNNNPLRSIDNEGLDIGNTDLTDTNTRNSHNGIGYRGHPASHSSSNLQTDANNEDHPTRASSHILRALDELRFTPRDPWLHVDQHIDHGPRLELSSCRISGSNSIFNNNSPPPLQQPLALFRRRMDYNVVDSDNEREEDNEQLIERVTGRSDPVPVEDLSDLDDYDTVIEPDQPLNRLALLTNPTDGNPSAVSNDVGQDLRVDVSFSLNSENDRSCMGAVNDEQEQGTNQDNGDVNRENNEHHCNASTPNNSTGNGDDVIILTMSPSPRTRQQIHQPQQQQQDVCILTPQPAVSQAPSSPTADPTADAIAAMATASISVSPSKQSNNNSSSSNNNCSGGGEGVDAGSRLDCDEFNSKLVSLLECPVCMETIVPPIQQCRKGHPVCHICRPKLVVCPTCRARFSENRNLLMEKVAEMMLFPCKNFQIGCPAKVQLKDKKKHELSCGFRQYDCIVSPCDWKGFKQELVVHVSSMHSSQVIVGNNQKIKVPLQPNIQSAWVLSAMDEVFVVTFIMKESILSGCTVYLGNFENAKNYFYEFTISRKDMRSQWRGKTFADKGHVNGTVTPYQFIANKGFSVSVNHSIIEDRDPRLLNKIDINVNVFKCDTSSASSSSSAS